VFKSQNIKKALQHQVLDFKIIYC